MVVTGGSDGIGKLIVQLFAERGVKVAVLDVQPLTYEAPSSVSYYKCDISSPRAIAETASSIRKDLGEPTVLINNAGVARGKTILDSNESDVRITFDVNTLSHYFLAKEFLPTMVRKNHGMVVTVASMAGYVSAPAMVDYGASKAAAIAFHEGLAAEVATKYNAPKVRTVLVTQSFTKTTLFKGFGSEDTWLTPALEPETVAEAVVRKVLGGESGQIVLPGGVGIGLFVRALPYWYQDRLRKKCAKFMEKWDGRQVVDPEVRYKVDGKAESKAEEEKAAVDA